MTSSCPLRVSSLPAAIAVVCAVSPFGVGEEARVASLVVWARFEFTRHAVGAAAHVKVEGEWNNDLLEQIKKSGPIGI
jgi:hypothetical protein